MIMKVLNKEDQVSDRLLELNFTDQMGLDWIERR